MILDLGSGMKTRPGSVGVDISPFPGVDVVADLDRPPYPFGGGVADEVYFDNVLEHLADVVGTLEEIHRIAVPGALITIYVPYFRSHWSAIDPTHRHQFSLGSFAYFDPAHPFFERYGYTSAGFTVESVTFNERWSKRGWRAALARYANRAPDRYEARLSSLFPLDELTFRLRVLKPGASG